MNPMVPGLTGDKMSSSVENSKIDLLDSSKSVTNKIKAAFCEPGNVDKNGVLSFAMNVLFNLVDMPYTINRPEKYGGKIEYNSVNDLFEDYKAEKLSPQDLKLSVTEYLNALLEPMRQSFETNTVWQKAREEGYGEKKVEKKACIFPSFLFLIPSNQRCPPCLPSSIQSRSNHQDLGAGGQ